MSSTTARPLAAVVEGASAVKTSAATNAPAARLRKNPARLAGQPAWIESTGRSAFALCALYNHYLADFAPEGSNRQAALPAFRQWGHWSARLAKKRKSDRCLNQRIWRCFGETSARRAFVCRTSLHQCLLLALSGRVFVYVAAGGRTRFRQLHDAHADPRLIWPIRLNVPELYAPGWDYCVRLEGWSRSSPSTGRKPADLPVMQSTMFELSLPKTLSNLTRGHRRNQSKIAE